MYNTIKLIAGVMANVPFPKSKAGTDICRETLNQFHLKPAGNCSRKNNINIQCDLHIIVPAYNVENYIRDCLDSVLEQDTTYHYIVTVINDGSKDRTPNILKEYQDNSSIEIIQQENRGLSGARNRGLETIKGRYVTFLDSDDKLSKDAIQSMLEMAYQTDADIIQGGWHEFGDGHNENKKPGINGQVLDIQGCFSGYPWGKFYKYSVLENFQFPEGFWFEDTPISFLLEALPLKYAAVDKLMYEYRINPNGITQKAAYNKKSVDSYWITEQCLQDFPKFEIAYDQKAYDYFMQQTVTNYLRTRRMPLEIRKAIFILTSDCRNKFFGNTYAVSDKKYVGIEQTLKDNNYIRYELLMIQFR